LRRFIALGLAALALGACTDTYHPEYHPVTVTNSSQNISYPVNVQSASTPSGTPGVTIVQQAPQQ
jgi:hypothetical protein